MGRGVEKGSKQGKETNYEYLSATLRSNERRSNLAWMRRRLTLLGYLIDWSCWLVTDDLAILPANSTVIVKTRIERSQTLADENLPWWAILNHW